MDQNTIYKQVIDAILADKIKAFGALAIIKAQETPGIQISDTGITIEINGEPKECIKELLKKLEEIGGTISTILAKNSVFSIKKAHPDLELPEELT